MPDSMLKFLAHVEVYKVVLARWENDDYSEHTAYINFPEYLGPYVSETLRQHQSYHGFICYLFSSCG